MYVLKLVHRTPHCVFLKLCLWSSHIILLSFNCLDLKDSFAKSGVPSSKTQQTIFINASIVDSWPCLLGLENSMILARCRLCVKHCVFAVISQPNNWDVDKRSLNSRSNTNSLVEILLKDYLNPCSKIFWLSSEKMTLMWTHLE